MNRSTAFLLGLLLILGVIVFFLLPGEGERESSYKSGEIHLAIDSSSTIKIEIQRTGKSVTLENVGGKWTLTSPILYAADQAAVHQLLGGLSKFWTGSLISSNPEKQNLFQVDSSGTKLTLTERSGTVTSVIIGKMGPSFSEVYFRLPNSKDVYLGQGVDSWVFSKEVKDWRDKSIISAPSEVVHGLTYTVGPKQYSFHKDSTGWKSGEKSLDANTMNPALNALATLRADDFIDTAMSMNAHPIALHISGADDVTLNLYPSLPDSARYYVQRGNANQFFVISKWTAQQLLKPIDQEGIHPRMASANSVKTIPTPQPAPESQPPAVTETKVTPKESSPKATLGAVKKAEIPKASSSDESKNQEQPIVRKLPPSRLATSPRTNPVEQTPSATPGATSGKVESKPPSSGKSSSNIEDEGDLTVYSVKSGETMTSIAKKFNVPVEQILKWNILKSITVKPGQELYIYVKK